MAEELTRHSFRHPEFGRKMYTDYEIMCRVSSLFRFLIFPFEL